MGTKANPGKFDCYAKAAPDEPIFVLRANDPIAREAVIHWAFTYKLRKEIENSKGNGPLPLNSAQQEKYDEALRCADAMEVWKHNHDIAEKEY